MRNALLLASALCACAREVPPPTVASATANTVSVRVHVDCVWPLVLDAITARVDGVPVPAGAPVATTDPIFSVEVIADVSVACGLLSSPRTGIRLQTAESLIGGGPAVADVYLFDDGDPTKKPASRLHARWAVHGASIEREYHGATPEECAGLSAARRAECRVAAALESARRQKDVVATLCEWGQLQAIREALPFAVAGDPHATQMILTREHQALHCVGAGPAYVGGTFVSEWGECGPEAPNARALMAP